MSNLKRYWYLIISALLALIGLLVHIPTGEEVVTLGLDSIFIYTLVLIAFTGLRKEGAFSLFSSFLSTIRHTYFALLFIALFSYVIGAIAGSFQAVLVMLPIASELLKSSEREKYIVRTSAIVVIASILGSMLLPSGSFQNIYLSKHLESGNVILTLLPLSLTGLILTFILPLLVLGKNVANELFIHDSVETDGSKPMRMLYICMMVIAIVTAAGAFFWLDILILFLVVLLIFDRSIFRRVDWSIPLTLMLLLFFSNSVSLSFTGKASAIITAELVGAPLASMLLSSFPDTALLIRAVNIGSIGMITSFAASKAFSMLGKDKWKFTVAYFALSIPVVAILIAVSALF